MIHTPRSMAPASLAGLTAIALSFSGGAHAGLRSTKIGAQPNAGDWVDRACATASQYAANGGCASENCQPVMLGFPQGAAAGVIAPAAAAQFTLPVPVDFIPFQLILHGAAIALQVTDMHTALDGPMIAGVATSPIGGDAFGVNVQEIVPLVMKKVSVGQSIFVTAQNPTLANVTFVASVKGLRA